MKKFNIIVIAIMLFSFQIKAQQTIGTARKIVVTGYDNTKLEAKSFVFKPNGSVKDLVLKIENIQAKLIIQGADRADIMMNAEGLFGLPEKAKGLRVVSKYGEDNTKIGLNVQQVGNEIKLIGTNVKRSREAVFTMTVPKEMGLNIDYKNWNSENLIIKNMKGGIEAQVSTSNVILDQVTGPLSISTHSGNIEVKYENVSSEAVTVLSSSSGDIDIAIAETANIDFNISQTSGEIFTDLDINFTNDAPVKPKEEKPQIENGSVILPGSNQHSVWLAYVGRIHSQTITKARLNKGGIRIDINSIAGDVYLRKK